MEIKDRIVKKVTELKNLSDNTDINIDINNPPKMNSLEDIEKFFKENEGLSKMQDKSKKIISELFALIDELDVIEGRGIQR